MTGSRKLFAKPRNDKSIFKIKSVLNIVVLLLICYFIFHSIYGDRGMISYFKLQAQLKNQHQKLASLRAERLEIENSTKLLRDDSMDKDMLDEKIRTVLGMSQPNEKIIKIENLE
ncbi:MAG: septum formation initiator family protein [Rickettsiaceae bacterium]|nr:septum formation initiator family protein [Rickettsiaceae bacterium]